MFLDTAPVTGPSITGVTDARIVTGGAEVLADAARIVRDAHHDVNIALFRTTHAPIFDALSAVARRGVHVEMLVDDREVARTPVPPWLASHAVLHGYGPAPGKQHSKAISIDGGHRVLVATDVSDHDALGRMEFAAELHGEDAAVVEKLLVATMRGDSAAQLDALAGAASRGVYANDPTLGWFGLTDTIESLLASARTRLDVATKVLIDARTGAALIAAAQRGVATRVLAHEGDPKILAALRDAGVHVSLVPYETADAARLTMHGTAIRSDERALFTTAYFDPRVLHGSTDRRSRELGMVLDGSAARQLDAAIDHVFAGGATASSATA
ncbi:MAG: hypothetical protein KDC46_04280 [Thermoleophilia bacterium]|nr:hypothetical protein [Thermoleophilia bacterium]